MSLDGVGKRQTLVMLPGMMCDARLFEPQVKAFSQSHEVTVPSIYHRPSVGELAESLLAELPESFALCGLSMGGIVAMEMMRQAPRRVSRIALLDTNPLAELEVVKAKRLPQIDAVKSGRLAEVMREEMKPNYLAAGKNRQEILDLCMDMALNLSDPVEAFMNQSLALMNRPDQTDTLKRISCPALVLCGQHDSLCPVGRHQLMAELIPKAQLQVIQDAGHLPTLEQPGATNAALSAWLAG